MNRTSAITAARPRLTYSPGQLLSLRVFASAQPCLAVRRAYTVAVRPRGRRAGRNLQRPISVRITSRDLRVYKSHRAKYSWPRSVPIVPEFGSSSSVESRSRHIIRRRSDRLRPGFRRPHITRDPSPTRIGSFNAQSVGNKYAAIADRIIAQKLHLCAVDETWHDSANSPQLIACAPPGYSFVEKARPSRGARRCQLAYQSRWYLHVPHSNPLVTGSTAAHVQNVGGPGGVHQRCTTKRVGRRHIPTGLTRHVNRVSSRVFWHPRANGNFLVPGDHSRWSEPSSGRF